ncbi:M3 family peptidase [Opitutaceae bacterium TAV4]|nr:M3 family peptidase [Opitutaceae bacterium TAV4]RRK02876.1 M3 family peptidase [Opitutaceae bacterium TAV3]
MSSNASDSVTSTHSASCQSAAADFGANPFLDPSFAIRWSAHDPKWIAPAIETALAGAQAAIDEIAGRPLAEVTFDNTFLALERATEQLNFAWSKVTHLQSVSDSPALREAHNAMLPKVSAFSAKIPLNTALWARLKAFAASGAAADVTGVYRRFLDETLADFRQAGADLPDEARARVEKIESELAELTQKYSENVLDATNAWQLVTEDEARLAGLPEHAVAAARQSARDKGFGAGEGSRPAWRFTLHGPSLEPVLTRAADEALRREVWTASNNVGSQTPHDNTAITQRILGLRAEKARLLGKAHFPDLVLERRMAGSGRKALDFVEDVERRARPAFVRECAELEKFAGVSNGQLPPWSVAFFSEKLRQQRYDFDDEALRPYFEVGRVIGGLFTLASRVFGLRIAEIASGAGVSPASGKNAGGTPAPLSPPQVEVWHPEVKFYEMHDRAGRHVGSFYADWHPRESKRGGAWMGYLITGGPRADGSRAPHLGYICGNLTPSTPGRPALLTHREVETIFHEFGHLLHHLLGEVPVKSLNGVNVAWDFVELPSQIMENWCWERESLDLFARHHETGTPIPDELFKKMIAARNFRSACATMRQVQFAKMDLMLHLRAAEFADGSAGGGRGLEAVAREIVADCMIPTSPPSRTIVKRFNHLFSDPVGYAAGYYSYKWAEVLDADAFTRFKREGIFNAEVGAQFIEHILSKGNSVPPAELFRRFMGRDPDPAALFVRNGLA